MGEEAKYWWWNLKELAEQGFLDDIARVGYENSRLEFHPKAEGAINPEHEGEPILRLRDGSGDVIGEYNITWLCPPFCD